MNPRNLSIVLICSALVGCASFRDGVLGKFHKYDPNEYALATGLVVESRGMHNSCGNLATVVSKAHDIGAKADFFIAYVEGRPNNNKTVALARDLRSMLTDTEDRTEMSEFFCKERVKNIVKAAELIRTHSGGKPE